MSTPTTPESSTNTRVRELPPLYITKDYTSREERDDWWLLKYSWQREKYLGTPYRIKKQDVRERRYFFSHEYRPPMSSMRLNYQKNNEIGAFLKLTNAFALVPNGSESDAFYNTISEDLKHLPVLKVSLCGCRIVGRMCVGNKNGLLVSDGAYGAEMEILENELPDSVKLVKIEEKLSALGNVIACNDHVALIHPEISKENEEVIADTLGVEVFRTMIGDNPLVGSYCILNNNGGMVQPDISACDLESLSSLLELPLLTGTVNRDCNVLGSGMAVNDLTVYAGMKTTGTEFSTITSAFSSR